MWTRRTIGERGAARCLDHVKKAVEATLKSHKSLEGIKVESVDNGVVLLDGRAKTLAVKLEAIEAVYDCPGVRQVASKIETGDQ